MSTPAVLHRSRELLTPQLVAAVQTLQPQMRLIGSYQFGWVDQDGLPTEGAGGKAIRPALALLSAEAAGAPAEVALPAAAAVELIHNFSLLHDDVMDADVERRNRPTAWTVFGTAQTILAGSALMALAIQLVNDDGDRGRRVLPTLLTSVQELIQGQSDDLRLEGSHSADLEQCLAMEAGKTASLLSCSAAVGALAAGAPDALVAALAGYGTELGMAFQLVDDVLGIIGDPVRTGKSSSSDVRAGKCSAPIAAALADGGEASRSLAKMLTEWPPQTEDEVAAATGFILDAGGVEWASTEADRRLGLALAQLEGVGIPDAVKAELTELAIYVGKRDR
jgi:geranylgeranyl diphosphate synthase, type I